LTVTEILFTKYGISAVTGKKLECPFCHHKTLSVKRDDTLAKCFYPACGRYITLYQPSQTSRLQVVFEEIYHDLHKELLKKNPGHCPAFNYLMVERKIHPKVIIDSMLGVVPRKYDIAKKLEKIVEEVKERMEKAKAEQKGKRGRPKNDDFDPDAFLKMIENIKEKWNKAARPGWLAFFYLDQHYHITTIRFRKPYSKEMYFFKPFKSEGLGLFGHQLFTPFKLPDGENDEYVEKIKAKYIELNNRMIVTEGEFNSLQLQSLWVRVAEGQGLEPDYLFTCSVGGAGGADYNCIKAAAKQPIFCYDNDSAGRLMVKRAQSFMNLTAFTVPESPFEDYNDIDDYIRCFEKDYERAFSKVKALLKERKPFPRTYESVAEEIHLCRQTTSEEDKRKQFEVFSQVSEIIKDDLLERGTFYHDERSAYIFFNLEKKLFAIHRDDFEFQNLLARYGLMASENIYKYVLDFLQAEAFQHGAETEIHRFAYFDKETFTLHLFNHRNQIYRISADDIELKDNGADQVLFLSDPQAESFDIKLPVKIDKSVSLLHEELIDKINFDEDILTIGERKMLFRYYFLSLFFESLMPTKIICCFVGEKGSGKSITLRKVGMLLFGSRFDVKSLPGNEDDFDVIALNSYLFFIDNADSKCPWLDDRLARIATGAVISRRELYTTAKLFSQAAKCFLGITSRTPHFRRDDVADRLLLMPVKRFDKIIPAGSVLSDIMEKRNAILAETLYLLQRAVQALEKWNEAPESGGFRMADFYAFAIKIAREEGCEEQLENIFVKLSKEQSLFTLGHDIIYDLLEDWINLKTDDGFGKMIPNSEREVTSNMLNKELSELAEKKNISYPYKDKPRVFAQRLANIIANLREFFDINVREGKGRTKIYAFILRQNDAIKPVLPF